MTFKQIFLKEKGMFPDISSMKVLDAHYLKVRGQVLRVLTYQTRSKVVNPEGSIHHEIRMAVYHGDNAISGIIIDSWFTGKGAEVA